VIQLLTKFFEKPKVRISLVQLKQLIAICKYYGIEITAKTNELIRVINHKSWNGIPHIHIELPERTHIALGLFSSKKIADQFANYCNYINNKYDHAIESEYNWRPYRVFSYLS